MRDTVSSINPKQILSYKYFIHFFQGNRRVRHSTTQTNYTRNGPERTNITRPVPVYINYDKILKKTKLVKILPALSSLKDNVKYRIINRKDGLFSIKQRKGISSLHVKPRKIRPSMSYQVDIEGIPIRSQKKNQDHLLRLKKSVLHFRIYML